MARSQAGEQSFFSSKMFNRLVTGNTVFASAKAIETAHFQIALIRARPLSTTHGAKIVNSKSIISNISSFSESSTLMLGGEYPFTVFTIDNISIAVELPNTFGILFRPVFTVEVNCWKVIFTVILTVIDCFPITVLQLINFFGLSNFNRNFKTFMDLRGGECKGCRRREARG